MLSEPINDLLNMRLLYVVPFSYRVFVCLPTPLMKHDTGYGLIWDFIYT